MYNHDKRQRSTGLNFTVEMALEWLIDDFLSGVTHVLSLIRPNNDLGHPLCGNLRDGNWLADYIGARLKPHKELENVSSPCLLCKGCWTRVRLSHITTL